jgi:hypothetical protein
MTGSCDEGIDSFHIVGHGDLVGYPGQHQTLQRSWTVDSEDSGINMSPVGPSPIQYHCDHTPGRYAHKWVLKREDFKSPIFMHKNKSFDSKFQMKVCGNSGCVLTFVLKLYPNGVNQDQNSSASLHVDILTPSGTQSASIVYFGVRVVEDRTTARHILTERKKICRLKEETGFLLDGFLPHEVVKTSQAKLLYMLFSVELSYMLGQDWVCVGTEHTLNTSCAQQDPERSLFHGNH